MSDKSMQRVCTDQEAAEILEGAVEPSAVNKERLPDGGAVKSRRASRFETRHG